MQGGTLGRMPAVERDPGLRERKKLRTRQTIVEQAFALFQERGFAATTIADIAAAADISPRTFFGYFPAKEDVLFSDAEEAFAAFALTLQEPREEPRTAVDVLRDWIHHWFTEHPPDHERELLIHRLKREAPGIDAHERHLMARFEDAMAAGLAVDLGLEPGDVRARMVAAAAVASLRALDPSGTDACGGDGPGKPDFNDAEALKSLDDALRFLDAGLAALRAG
ncbi:MAG: transcriptional regulator, TetR family [Solirubrobacterales bacterium]|nr:transcriptional regulator, TetR family [Solirubrobacterales bacterium]